jgi:ferredoxin-NADP reductase
MSTNTFEVRVRSITHEAANIFSYELFHPNGEPLPSFTAGAHIDYYLPDKRVRQYSLCNSPEETHRYKIAVLRDERGRGGSGFIHDNTRVGDAVRISRPRNNFPLNESAKHHLFIAGGIGITPIMAMIERVKALRADFTLHYCTRTAEQTAFLQAIQALPHNYDVHLHHDQGVPERGLNIVDLLKQPRPETHVYCCGPTGLIGAVNDAAGAWPEGTISVERFSPASAAEDTAAAAFSVKIASTGAVFPVPPGKTVLQVLREHGVKVDSFCEAGVCGTCRTRFIAGEPEHKDDLLLPEERQEFVLVCVSRCKTPLLVLDL